MTAQPIHEPDPDDPVQTLRMLPEQYRAQFLDEYTAAVEQARPPEHYHQLHELLRLWRLRAVAYSDPGYQARLDAALDGQPDESVPAEDLLPEWPLEPLYVEPLPESENVYDHIHW